VSEPKRYQPVVQCVEPSYQAQMIEPKVMEFSEGEYVLHSDYARLKAEVEQLTRAGDAMEMTLQADFNGCPYEPTIVREAMIYWRNSKNAAKKGGQP
jgi:hypothetical protein